ncbi:MAG: hypothetical protein ABRQ37_24790 [Candidatus Eremiobacterota bacterium]
MPELSPGNFLCSILKVIISNFYWFSFSNDWPAEWKEFAWSLEKL